MKQSSLRRTLLPLVTGVLLVCCLFGLCYRYDNKYTTLTPQGTNGALVLDGEALQSTPVVFLVRGWIAYTGLYTPEELKVEPFLRGREVYIGQYAGFEAFNTDKDPHGSVTMLLHITLPREAAQYTLELPEIYSAYRLYINGSLMYQLGNPEPNDYRVKTGNAAVSFSASGSVEIVLAISDFSHVYSGLVYPPAFGVPEAVDRLLASRLVIRTGVCALALFLGVFFLILELVLRRNAKGNADGRQGLLYGVMCLCFLGYTCYPVLKTLFFGGLWWYTVETFCHSAMLFTVALLQTRLCRLEGRVIKLFFFFAGTVTLCTLFTPLLAQSGLSILLSYSRAVRLYFIICAFYLTLTTLYAVKHVHPGGRIMLCAVAVFDVALVMDRLLPDYEPIRTGWFAEWAGFVLVLFTGVVIGQEIAREYRRRAALENNLYGMRQMMAAQEAYYPMVAEQAEQARAARHDMRHHLAAVNDMAKSREYEALQAYLSEYSAVMEPTPTFFCQHKSLNMLFSRYTALAATQGTRLTIRARLPALLPLSDTELFALLSNLLENGMWAVTRLPEEYRWSELSIQEQAGSLVIVADNSFDGQVDWRGGRLYSRKEPGREGIGTATVGRITRSQNGTFNFRWRDDGAVHIFSAEVIIPMLKEET